MKAFILAGGFATRLMPLTEKRAKPLLPIAGKPLISHLVAKIPKEIPIIVSTNAAFIEGYRIWEESLQRKHLTLLIETSRKDEQKMGALGAVADWISQESIDEDILLLTGDNYLGFSLTHFLSTYHQGIPLLAAFDIRSRKSASLFGTVLLDKKNPAQIIGFEEKPKDPKTTLVSTGCSVLPREIFPILIEFAQTHPDNIGGLFEELIRRHMPVECFVFVQPWVDIGSFSSYMDAHRLLVGQHSLLDPGATVEHSTLEGSISIGKGTTVIDSTLTDCIIFDHCIIRNCTLKNCIIDNDCNLQGVDLSDKMLRTGTELNVK